MEWFVPAPDGRTLAVQDARRWLVISAGADDAVDERSRVSASRYASVHMAV